MRNQVFINARIVGAEPGVTAFRTRGDRFSWTGPASQAPGRCVNPPISLEGAWVTPGFVDAHVHMTMTGLMASGLDLHDAAGAQDIGDRVARVCRESEAGFIWGYGWDDSSWASPPSAGPIEQAASDRYVYLARVDGHSALVSWKLFGQAGCAGKEGADPETGLVQREAHHAVRDFFLSRLPAAQIRAAHVAAARMAAAKGITTVHEMSGPLHAAGERDLDLLLGSTLPVSVVCYYASEDISVATSRGLRQIGGDFNADGAVGSRTAALSAPYSDIGGHRGFLYKDSEALGRFFLQATRAGLQAGVHCIGDAGCEAAVQGLEIAARECGAGSVKALRHRLEHFEMSGPDLIRRAVAVGAAFSMQPAFDAHWGGPDGMYRKRLGERRARGMNNLAEISRLGGVVGFGSDSPVTPLDPIAGIRAAIEPSNPSHAISSRDALRASTVGGHALARQEQEAGTIAPGMRADFVVWSNNPLAAAGAKILATVSRGRVVYGNLPPGEQAS